MTAVLLAEGPSAKYLVKVEPALVRGFELLATAPGGIARLRGLLVALAVRGLLVRQILSDEPATELVRRIAKAGGRTPPSFTVGGLPMGWARIAFGDYASEINTGPFGSLIGKGEYVEGGVPLVNPSHMRHGRIVAEANVSVSEGKAVELSSYRLTAGDIVFARRGEVGRTALVTEAEQGWLCGTGSFLARFHTDASREYIQLVFASSAMRAYLGGEAVGSTMVNLNQRALRSAAIDLPPLAEQRRIVARVEELMKLCDALEQNGRLADEQHARLTSTLFDALAASESAHALAENWQRVAEHFDLLLDRPEAIDALEQTVLELAVRGLLVPQDSSDEHAGSLRQRIHGERTRLFASGAAKREKALKPVEEDEHAFPLPANWVWVRFDELVRADKPIAYGVLVPGPDTPEGVPFVRLADLSLDCPAAKPEKSIAANVDAQFARTRLEGGEILLGVVGSIGKLGVAPETWKGANIARAICRIVPTSLVDRSYVLNLLQSEFMRARFSGDTRTLAQPTLNVGLIRECPTPLPPLAEQRRIVARVEELRRLCAQLRERLTDARRTQSHLADALVAEVAA